MLFAHPGVGAITLALLFGLFNLVFGARALVQGFELRRAGNAVQSAVHEQIPARASSGYPHSSAASPAMSRQPGRGGRPEHLRAGRGQQPGWREIRGRYPGWREKRRLQPAAALR